MSHSLAYSDPSGAGSHELGSDPHLVLVSPGGVSWKWAVYIESTWLGLPRLVGFLDVFCNTWLCLEMGYTTNEIAIFHRDNDQQNHWVFRGTQHFQTNPCVCVHPGLMISTRCWQMMFGNEMMSRSGCLKAPYACARRGTRDQSLKVIEFEASFRILRQDWE